MEFLLFFWFMALLAACVGALITLALVLVIVWRVACGLIGLLVQALPRF